MHLGLKKLKITRVIVPTIFSHPNDVIGKYSDNVFLIAYICLDKPPKAVCPSAGTRIGVEAQGTE